MATLDLQSIRKTRVIQASEVATLERELRFTHSERFRSVFPACSERVPSVFGACLERYSSAPDTLRARMSPLELPPTLMVSSLERRFLDGLDVGRS